MSSSALPSVETLKTFESIPACIAVLAPDLTILAASDCYLQETQTSISDIQRKSIFLAFPDNPDTPEANSVENLRNSLQKVLESKIADRMLVQRYDVPDLEIPGRYITRYWEPLNTPVLNEIGEIQYIIHLVTNVTDKFLEQDKLEELRKSQNNLFTLNNELGFLVEQGTRAQAESEQNLHSIVMSARYSLMLLRGTDWVIEIANQHLADLWGKPLQEITGKNLMEILPEIIDQPFSKLLKQVYDSGLGYGQEEEALYLETSEGKVTKYVSFYYDPLKNSSGEVSGIIVSAHDISDRVHGRMLLEKSLNEQQEVNEELGTANEELAAANEELVSLNESLAEAEANLTATNEKLSSANIELDQSHSEMAAINEQLSATNEELYEAQLLLQETISLLKVSDGRFRNLIRDATVGIILLSGSELRVEIVNDACTRLIGRTAEEIDGRPLFEIVPEAEPIFRPIINSVRESGEPLYLYDTPYQVNSDTGMINGFLNLVYQPFREKNGEITGVIILCQDVTEQVIAKQKIEANERHFRHMADLIPTKISNGLPSGEVTFFNKAWLDYSGLSFEDLRDFGYHAMLHPEEIEKFQQGLAQAAANGKPYESEMRFKDLDGNYRWHLNIASPILDDNGQIIMWVGSTTDIQKIKEEEQRKNAFIGMVSHELKTPLTSLNAYLQMLQAKKKNSADNFENNAIKQAVKQSRKMTAMINGFLNISRFDSSEILIKKQPFDMVDLLNETREEMELLHSSHAFDFSSNGELIVAADRDKVGHVLNNLIGNACKYSNTDSRVAVKCWVFGDDVVVAVKDEGVGVKEEDFDRLFERYFRVRNDNAVSGFGIGLYLCAEIVKQHGGKIWVESEFGKGSTFSFSLPI